MNVQQSISSEIKTFIQNNKALCVLTLGLAILVKGVGCLGGRAITAIYKVFGTTKKADKQGQDILNPNSKAKPVQSGKQNEPVISAPHQKKIPAKTLSPHPQAPSTEPTTKPPVPNPVDVPSTTNEPSNVNVPNNIVPEVPKVNDQLLANTANKISTLNSALVNASPSIEQPSTLSKNAGLANTISDVLKMEINSIPWNSNEVVTTASGWYIARTNIKGQTILFLQDPLAWNRDPVNGTSIGINLQTREVRLSNPDNIITDHQVTSLLNKFCPLEATALASPYGNKFKGLQEIHNLVTKHSLENVVVPLPKGISHDQVYQILSTEAPEIFVKWNRLAQEFEHSGSNVQFLDDPKTKKILEEIRGEIEAVFLKTTFDSPELSGWLAQMQGNYLMVRSSSIEDTNQIVNAGGNLSEAYIPPERKQVLASCGRVVASYFGEASLKNQIQAHTNPFVSNLQLSVIMQELIGESIDNKSDDIPVSLVFFTSEPNYSEEGFRVSTISSTHGHGEGVVNNEKVKTDTVYAVHSRANPGQPVEVYQKKSKPQRLAPVQSDNKVNLQLVGNQPELSDKRCLPKAMVKRLLELGDLVEKEKGCPMDMEIVIKGDKIYVVQMRDIKRKKANPTYLSDEAIQATGKDPIIQTKNTKVLVAGKSSALKISSKKQVLHCKTLKEAEDKFVSGKHKAIIVDQDEPALSHPVINFSGMGIPCFFNEQETTMLLKQINPQKPLVACPQSGRICLWDQNLAPLDDCIKPGFFSHPAYMEFKMGNKSPITPYGTIEVPKEITEALLALNTAQTEAVALDTLKRLQQLSALTELKSKIIRLESETRDIDSPQIKAQIKTLKKIDKHIQRTFGEIGESYVHEAPCLEKLFHIKTLSTLLQGNQTSSSFSLMQVDSHIATIDRAIAYEKQLSSPAKFVQLLEIDSLVLNAQDKPRWEAFLLSLEKQPMDEKPAENFKNLMQALQESGSLSLWLNLVFLPKAKEIQNPALLLAALIPKEGREAQAFSSLTKAIKELEGFDPAVFSDPQRFNKHWESTRLLMQQYASTEMLNNLGGSELNQFLTTGLMRKYTDLIDETIKTVKSSPHFSDQEKLTDINQILLENYQVMKTWIEIAHKRDQIPMHGDLLEYFNVIDDAWKQIDFKDLKNLKPAKGFSVLAATLGSKALIERHKPKTLEDIFTLIHQNQLFALTHINKFLTNDQLIQQLGLPELMTKFPEVMKGASLDPKMTGLEITPNGMIMKYNIALNNHSLCVELECNKASEITMHVKFFGERGSLRWRDISVITECMDEIGLIKANRILPYTDQEIQFSWDVNKENPEMMLYTLSTMVDIANRGRGPLSTLPTRIKNLKNGYGEKFASALFNQKIFYEEGESYLRGVLDSFKESELILNACIKINETYGKSNDKDVLHQEIKHICSLIRLIFFSDLIKKTINVRHLIKNCLSKDPSITDSLMLIKSSGFLIDKEFEKEVKSKFIQERINKLQTNQISNKIVQKIARFLHLECKPNNPILQIALNAAETFVRKLSPEDLKSQQVGILVRVLQSKHNRCSDLIA